MIKSYIIYMLYCKGATAQRHKGIMAQYLIKIAD